MRMVPRAPWTASVLAILATLLAPSAANATIHYKISAGQREEHLVGVSMTVPSVRRELTVKIPAWNALYQIRDFAQYVQNVRARDAQARPLAVTKLDKQTWSVRGDGTLTIEYSIFADEPGAFSAQLNADHAFLNLALVLFYSPDRRGEDVRLEFHDMPADWRIAVALKPGDSPAMFTAANYDALVDAPVEAGRFDETRFQAGPARIRVVIHGEGPERKQLEEMLQRVVAYQVELMQDVPFEEYIFFYHFGQGGGGGMEHANSTAIHTAARTLPTGVSAHEFFHLWNVKRIRPRSLEPVDYTRENWTRALWFAEGVTSTYGSYTLVRSGLISPKDFYDDLAGQIRFLESRPSRMWKSLEEASLDAWLEKYPYYNRPGASLSYYNKGQIVGVLLDILLRELSDNRASLDHVLRHLNKEFAKQGGYYDDSAGIRAAAEAVLHKALEHSGRAATLPAARERLTEFFTQYVSGTAVVPYDRFLKAAGLLLKFQERLRVDLGFQVNRGPGTSFESVVARVQAGSAAESAGLRTGDVLLQMDGVEFPRNPESWLRSKKPGDTPAVRVRRNGQEREFSFVLGQRSEPGYEIEEDPQADEKARRLRAGLLRGKTD